MKVNILGQVYEIIETDPAEDRVLKDVDGYCDPSVKVCVIDSQKDKDPDSLKDMEAYKRKVTRHEIIHAFLFESGLCDQCDWACEEMVDWLAYQFPKMAAVFQSAGCSD